MPEQVSLPISVEQEFPVLGHVAWLNHAGVSPICARAAKMLRWYTDEASLRCYLPSNWHKMAIDVKQYAARLLNAQSAREIAFIPNTSTGIALVANGIAWNRGDNVVITSVEFPSNRYPWENLKRLGVDLIEVKPQPDGRIDVEDVCDAITDRTRVVAISHVQYGSGHRINLRPIADMVHQAGGYLSVDAIQSLGAFPVDVEAMGIDFLSADGHKWLLSPEGAGIFYCRQDLAPLLHPAIVGWMNVVDPHNHGDYHFQFQSDARRFEPGAMNIPGILAMGESIKLVLEVGIHEIAARIDALTTRLCEKLEAKEYRVFSPRRLPDERSGILVFDPPYPDTRITPSVEQIIADLEKRGTYIVVREGRLRCSPHFYNTVEQIDALVEALP